MMNNLEINSKLNELTSKILYIHSFNRRKHQDYNLYSKKTLENNHTVRLALKEYDRIIMSCNKLKAVLESYISNISRVALYVHSSLKKSLSEDDWIYIEEKVLAHLQSLSSNPELDFILKSTKSEKYDVDLHQLIDELENNRNSPRRRTSLDNLLYGKLKKLEKYYLYLIDKIALAACRALYVKICAEILNRMYLPINEEKVDSTDELCEDYKLELYNGLKAEDRSIVNYYAYQLLSLAEISASYHINSIIQIQDSIYNSSNEKTTLELLNLELEEFKKIKARIWDYAFGLYFHSATPAILDRETRYALKLDYNVTAQEVDFIPLNELFTHASNYINQDVKVSGVVTSIREKKWFIGAGEAVRSEFKISENGTEIDVYTHGRMLRDNGLEEGCLIEIQGIFEKKDDEEGFQLKIARFNQAANKNRDWVSRCHWLVKRWWDYGTDNTMCDWTFTKKIPGAILQGGSRREILKFKKLKEELDARIKKEKKDFPLVRAILAIDKKIIDDTRNKRLKGKIDPEFLDAIKLVKFYEICLKN